MKFLTLPEIRCERDHLQGFVFWSFIFTNQNVSLPQFCEQCLLAGEYEMIGL